MAIFWYIYIHLEIRQDTIITVKCLSQRRSKDNSSKPIQTVWLLFTTWTKALRGPISDPRTFSTLWPCQTNTSHQTNKQTINCQLKTETESHYFCLVQNLTSGHLVEFKRDLMVFCCNWNMHMNELISKFDSQNVAGMKKYYMKH